MPGDQHRPQVSVLMTVYNGGSYLAEAIESVLSQDFSDFELLVVDDASTDDSLAIVRQYALRDDRVRVFCSESNAGPVGASNLGLAHARGQFVARLDADDLCSPDRLRRQVATLEACPDLVLLGTAFDYIDGGGRLIATNNPPVDNTALQAALQTHSPFCHSSVMMRTEAVHSLGGYRELVNRYALDYDLMLRLAEVGTVGNLPDRLVRYRVHPGQITARKLEMQVLSAEVYRALARQRRRGDPEDLDRALAETHHNRRVLRNAVVSGYVFWADMMDRFAPRQARQLRWRTVRMAPFHPRVLRMLLSRARRALC